MVEVKALEDGCGGRRRVGMLRGVEESRVCSYRSKQYALPSASVSRGVGIDLGLSKKGVVISCRGRERQGSGR